MTFLKTAALTAMLGITATTGFAQDVTLRFQHFVSPNSANPKYFLDPWVEKVESESNGRIKIEIYPFLFQVLMQKGKSGCWKRRQ